MQRLAIKYVLRHSKTCQAVQMPGEIGKHQGALFRVALTCIDALSRATQLPLHWLRVQAEDAAISVKARGQGLGP